MQVMQGIYSMIGILAPEHVSLLSHIDLLGGQQHMILQDYLPQSTGRQLCKGSN